MGDSKNTDPKLTKVRVREINKIFDDKHDIIKNKYIGEFITNYINCEALARKLISYYMADRQMKQPTRYQKLKTDTIARAAKHFEVDISEDAIEQVFKGGNGKRNHKTPRQLRNAYIHTKSTNDALEIVSRNKELIKRMQVWLNAVKYTR